MTNRTADLPYLLEQLHLAEDRFNSTQREVKGNKVVRAPRAKAVGGGNTDRLIGETGKKGIWYADLHVGAVNQPVDLDLDMLTADFAITSTSSGEGTRFDELWSHSYQKSDVHPFPYCTLPKDNVLLPTTHQLFPLNFPHCKPSRQSLATLHASGGILGLAPAESLKQIPVTGLIQQLVEFKVIQDDVFSVTLINGYEGILSLGGTVADSVASIENRIESFLGRSLPAPAAAAVVDPGQDAVDLANGAPEALINQDLATPGGTPPQTRDVAGAKEKREIMEEAKQEALAKKDTSKSLFRRGIQNLPNPFAKEGRRKAKPLDQAKVPSWRDSWQWSPVEGAEGWWQTLMRGVWVDGVKVLKNQPVVLDLSSPFVMAPPLAAKQFYSSISGSRRLPPPYTNFYAFPCNNPPMLHVEFAGWRFPLMKGMKEWTSSSGPNNRFSLGKVNDEGSYCVGAVVETRMGVGDQAPVKKGHSRKDETMRGIGALESGMLAGNGMRDVWVMGEPTFRGIGLVFDRKAKSIGFRSF